ncbi:MAG: hypothetical protein WBP59_11970, partial [Ilumatobacteraceae bacterium]
MTYLCTRHHRAGLAVPLDSADHALLVATAIIARPLTPQTHVVVVDHDRRVSAILSVTGTIHPDAMFDVLDHALASVAADRRVAGLVLVSVRPDGIFDPGDVDRWLEASDA